MSDERYIEPLWSKGPVLPTFLVDISIVLPLLIIIIIIIIIIVIIIIIIYYFCFTIKWKRVFSSRIYK